MLARKWRMTNQHPHRVIDSVIGVSRHAIGLMRQPVECPIEFLAITGERLNCFYPHAKGHHRENGWMFGQTPRKLAHGIADPRHLFGGHAAREVKRKDDRHRTRRALDLLDIERSDWPLGAVFVELEIFFFQVAYQAALRI